MSLSSTIVKFLTLPLTTANYREQPRRTLLAAGVDAFLLGFLVIAIMLLSVLPGLPPLDVVTDYQPKIPLRVYSADGALLAEFGEEHRDFVPIQDIPQVMKDALLAIEDSRFYEHGGVDYRGVTRALVADLTGGFHQGASTITMQVARNFFLTREKTVTRKLTEALLAYRIESALSKDQILELYMNQIYLGQRTHGFASAARTYFNKRLPELSIAEAAMLAGIPQNPAKRNPAVNPVRAKARQMLVLKRMLQIGKISEAQYDEAVAQALKVNDRQLFAVHADYAAELVRQELYTQYKGDTYTRGFNVYTTLNAAEQNAAYNSLRSNVLAYDQRHGYRGAEDFIELPDDEDERDDAIDRILAKHPNSDNLIAAVVTEVSAKRIRAEPASGDTIEINGDGLRFAARALQTNARPDQRIRVGSVIRASRDGKGRWMIGQMPDVEAAFVALNAEDGSYRALVGGFDFARKQFNHVTSAWRQPGSSIKPFVYSAALEKGFSPATQVNDAPISLPGGENGQAWEPQNDDGYDGPISLRRALARSKNIVAVRLLRAISPQYGRDYLQRFGFDPAKHPANLTMTLGSGSVTPLQMAGAYAIFANGGYKVAPHLIQKVTDARGNVLRETPPPPVRQDEQRVIDSRNAFIMDSMLREVAHSGTGALAGARLGRPDVAGKTGTTSDAFDGWFAGYAGNVVAVAWMGFDQPKSLGGREFGATLALPIWIDYMRQALAGKPLSERAPPAGVSFVDGDWMYDEFNSESGIKTLDFDAPLAPTIDKIMQPLSGG
ncbi:penicillin-binding protein 1A [Quatrionicoccus australiensis]|uniref:penicillin-binding protein 1A n=1 Tax=Quatrionicoccus australiensis TaxID=138118 RepID=UPI001CFA0505|nr:penicillin-binding protein 1A [Quatrionicoccus australiensis]MCB4361595.1 penicillin-binding protein 1A [Quatrionicoccus australiensis]